jgi:hypothetical protein
MYLSCAAMEVEFHKCSFPFLLNDNPAESNTIMVIGKV